MNLRIMISTRENSLKNTNFRTKTIHESYLINSNYDLNNVNTYIKELPYNIKSFNESLDKINEYKSKNGTNGDNILYKSLRESMYHIDDIEYCSELLKEKDNNINLFNECELLYDIDRMRNNYKKLNKLIDLNNIINHCNNDEICYEVCESISNYTNNNNPQTLFNLSLESLLYIDSMYSDINLDNILEDCILYFSKFNDICNESDIEYVLEKNKLINKTKNKVKSKINKVKDKSSSKTKELVSKLKNTKLDDFPTMKKILYKLYTYSPENIIEETPPILYWIRAFALHGTLVASLGPIGLVPVMVDLFLQMTLKRKHTEEILKKYKKEQEIVEKKLSKVKNKKKREQLEKYNKELEKAIYRIEDFNDKLYSEKKQDERNGYNDDNDFDDFEESTDFNNYINSISQEEYLDNYHNNFIKTVDNMSHKFNMLLAQKGPKLIRDRVYSPIDIEEIERFRMVNEKTLHYYINRSNKICVELAIFLPYNTDINKIEIYKILESIIPEIEKNIYPKYNLYISGGDDMFKLYIESSYRVECDDYTRNSQLLKKVAEDSWNNPITLSEGKDLEFIENVALIEGICDLSKKLYEMNLLNIIKENISSYSYNDLLNINKLVLIENSLINKNNLISIYKDYKKETTSIVESSYMASLITDIEKPSILLDFDNRYTTFYELYSLYNYAKSVQLNSLNETSIVNSLKIAKEKLVKTSKKLSDKDKLISNRMDNALDKVIDSAQKAMTSKNREAVIKGSVIPSASSLLKLAIVSGVAGLINPAIAVVTLLGGLAASKHGTQKERQFILDEIDIQLKMVEKKLQLAERNNDMEAIEELLKLERSLKREKQRIYYKTRANNYRV